MRYADMERLIDAEFERIKELRRTKGLEYASEEDTLADFKEVAVETGITPLQVWATYVKKHERAIDTYIREGGVKSESIESRIRDVVVYHLLLLGLIRDEPESLVTPADLVSASETPYHPLKCGVIASVDVYNGAPATICCELEQGHPAVNHYGRTVEGHGYQWPVVVTDATRVK